MKQNLSISNKISIDLSLIAHSSDGIVIADSNANILWVNSSFEQMSQYALGESAGKHLAFLSGTFTDKEVLDRIHWAIADGRPLTEEILLYKKDNAPFWVSFNLTPVRNDENKVSHFVASMRDITARKDTERQIVRLQAQLAGMKYLEGWIVQCAWDKTVKDKTGNFIQLETFIERYTDARFTHGISPEARDRVKKKKKT